ILGIILFGILSVKSGLHKFVRTGITKKEMSASLTFLLSAFVILPLLPDDFIDPWGLIQPTRIWLLFVLIAGVQFFSYIALRFVGSQWGMLLTGLLGGFVSATATTLSLALKVKQQPKSVNLIAGGIILAEVSSLIIQMIVITIIIADIPIKLLFLLAIPAITGIIIALFLTFISPSHSIDDEEKVAVNVNNPISLKSTLTFALLISFGLIIIALAARYVGTSGVYITSALGGFASQRVVTFSVSELVNSGEMLTVIAATSILLAMTTNMLAKLVIIKKAGSTPLFLVSGVSFLLMLISGYIFHFWELINSFSFGSL
ncbi:MAG: MgtC/SapB family protein, partial [Marinicellaceae bacterium]